MSAAPTPTKGTSNNLSIDLGSVARSTLRFLTSPAKNQADVLSAASEHAQKLFAAAFSPRPPSQDNSPLSTEDQKKITSLQEMLSGYQAYSTNLHWVVSWMYPKLWYFTAGIVTLYFLNRMGSITTVILGGLPGLLAWECYACKETLSLLNILIENINTTVTSLSTSNRNFSTTVKIIESDLDVIAKVFQEKVNSFFFLKFLPVYIVSEATKWKGIINRPTQSASS